MTWLAPLALLFCSSAVLWYHRPGPQWPGASASGFMAALLAVVTGVALLLSHSSLAVSDELLLLLRQACLFAGVPLIAAIWLADLFGKSWDRVIWGRVLLGLCAMFELGRRGDWLDTWLLITLAAGMAGSVLCQIRYSQWLRSAALALLWLFSIALTFPDSPVTVSALSADYEIWVISAILLTGLLRTKTAA